MILWTKYIPNHLKVLLSLLITSPHSWVTEIGKQNSFQPFVLAVSPHKNTGSHPRIWDRVSILMYSYSHKPVHKPRLDCYCNSKQRSFSFIDTLPLESTCVHEYLRCLNNLFSQFYYRSYCPGLFTLPSKGEFISLNWWLFMCQWTIIELHNKMHSSNYIAQSRQHNLLLILIW